MSDSKLQDLRVEIDALDERLVELLNRRARLALEVATVKQRRPASTLYRPEREAQVLKRVKTLNKGPLPADEIARLVREVMSACLALEAPLTVACLGPEGTFTEAAAYKHFGHSVRLTLLGGIDQVFREVSAGACHYGVVPVENSVEGAVNQTLDKLLVSDLKVCGEVELRIRQQLLSRAQRLDAIETVYSHEQSLAQCRRWLDANLAQARRVSVTSNAAAVVNAGKDERRAAIAGTRAGQLHGLPVLRQNIEDNLDNTTRFLVLGREAPAPSGSDKTSVLFAMPSAPGSLVAMLACFADHGVNMTRIESRPSRQGIWEYVFFVDLVGHAQDTQVKQALSELSAKAAMMKLLGSYPVVATTP
ncbi:MAG: prephenate dehydratase [Gammaproteobacteria bacterium]|nr:prephenate dehydratase [Gammaproteobacteria bacterium]MCY4337870.1 prephenate dehydratase [Gammaproteobacteria bacterium]